MCTHENCSGKSLLEVEVSYILRGSLSANLPKINFLNLQLMSVAQETW